MDIGTLQYPSNQERTELTYLPSLPKSVKAYAFKNLRQFFWQVEKSKPSQLYPHDRMDPAYLLLPHRHRILGAVWFPAMLCRTSRCSKILLAKPKCG